MRLLLRTLSELCITAGAVIVLFVAYVTLWTGVRAEAASDAEKGALERRWAASREVPAGATQGSPSTSAPPPGPAAPSTTTGPSQAPAPSPSPAAAPYRDGEPFAVMYVPRFGKGWEWPVLEGTAAATLKKGLGHYTGTAPPGGTGNFSVAGHRRTYGDPFKDFPRLRPGDAVILNDGTTWFTYRVERRPYRTVPGDIAVVDPVPVPEKSGFTGPGRYLTLTTCDPEWGSSHRLVAWARLAATRPVTQGEPPAFHS
ncbi:class E sortase [Streptomyces sp. TRM49041]|uniref:class E sortase n=1 Tax=Streptomyces sp. TRM49041 TaxID=2603216 RepID=UPI0011F0406A|nr:class E sortase [Streptomyces sp. TRM49041]